MKQHHENKDEHEAEIHNAHEGQDQNSATELKALDNQERRDKRASRSKKRLRFSEIINQSPSSIYEKSRPIKIVPLKINTFQSKKFIKYAEKYDLWMHSLYSLLLKGGDEIFERAIPAIRERLKVTLDYLNNNLERLLQCQESNLVVDVSYTDIETFEISVSTPLTLEFIDCISITDKIIVKIDSLWLDGIFNDRQRMNGILEVNNSMYELVKDSIKAAFQSKKEYNKKLERERANRNDLA